MPDMKFKPQGHQELNGGHERRDIHYKAVIASGAALLFAMAATAFVLIYVDRFFLKWAGGIDPEPVSRLESNADPLPPLPRLQVSPRMDMEAMYAEEKKRLEEYAYDEVTGMARIPVEVAIDLLAKRGLPTRVAAASEGSSTDTMGLLRHDNTTGTAESSSGRLQEGTVHQ